MRYYLDDQYAFSNSSLYVYRFLFCSFVATTQLKQQSFLENKFECFELLKFYNINSKMQFLYNRGIKICSFKVYFSFFFYVMILPFFFQVTQK